MPAPGFLDNLFRYNDWANTRIANLSQGLSDAQIDAPLPMGFGTLRATLFHILTAEQVWLERWRGEPWRQFPMDPQGTPLAQVADDLARVSKQRREFLRDETVESCRRTIRYRDSRGNEYTNPLDELLLHVANHGIAHRAQALHFLKQQGRVVPAGLDYTFYRLAHPVVTQSEATTAALRQFGLEVNVASGEAIPWDPPRVQRYFAYHDWANSQILPLLADWSDAQLDRDFGMGPGTVRKTLCHLAEAEGWWLKNWKLGTSPFERYPANMPLAELRDKWKELATERDAFVQSLAPEDAYRVVTVNAGGMMTQFQVIESLVQLCMHGTHHRAQLSNMLRQSDVPPPPLDYIVWVRQTA